MSEDLNKLRELAEAATPGPWTNTPAHSIGFKSPMPDFHKAHIHVGPRDNYGNALACAIMGGPGATGSSAAEVDANAAFIAAFNPATALSLLSRLQAAEERAEKLEADNAQLKLTASWAKTFGAAHDMMQDALKAISYHADNQNIGHIDYRMHAKQQADHVLEACAGSPGLLDLAPTPKPDWSDGQWKWADDERASALKTEGA